MDLNKLPKRFLDKMQPCPLTGCWNWSAGMISAGYSAFGSRPGELPSREIYAHRFAYRVLVGEIEKGKHLDHLCRNRACSNPMHLEVVSPRENLMRGAETVARLNSEKTHCLNGHALSGSNLRIIIRNGKYKIRVCKKCDTTNAMSRYHAKRRAAFIASLTSLKAA